MKLVVVGADAAGMSAASQARKLQGPDQLEIVAFERGHFSSYSACGIPYWIGGAVTDRDALIARDPAAFEKAGIAVRLRHEVVAIDLDRREVVARDLEGGGERREGFDELVYAAGAVPITPEWARIDGEGVFGVQTLDDPTQRCAVLDGGQHRDQGVGVLVGGGERPIGGHGAHEQRQRQQEREHDQRGDGCGGPGELSAHGGQSAGAVSFTPTPRMVWM